MPAEVWQYNSALEVARIFHLRIDFARVVPMVGRHTYVGGKGIMHGKLLGVVTVRSLRFVTAAVRFATDGSRCCADRWRRPSRCPVV